MGKDNSRKMNWAKIVVKISQQKCWLFNIYEKNLNEAFQIIKIPTEVNSIKNGAQIILTSHRTHNMFVIGGEEKGRYLGHNFSYNFLSLSFTPCASMNEAKVNFGAIYFKENVFVVGGWKQFYSKRCEMYSLENNRWIDIPNLQ